MTSISDDTKGKQTFEEADLMSLVMAPLSKKGDIESQEIELHPITFWCKDCHQFVEVEKRGKTLAFSCKECHKNHIAFGTKHSMESFYKGNH